MTGRYAIAYVAALIVFAAADFVWLGFIAKDFYRSQIGGLLLAKPGFVAAALFYLLYVAGVVIFVIAPALAMESNSAWSRAALFGALFGLVAYATYDLSNLATLKGWSIAFAVVDIAWGSFATGIAAVAGFQAANIASR